METEWWLIPRSRVRTAGRFSRRTTFAARAAANRWRRRSSTNGGERTSSSLGEKRNAIQYRFSDSLDSERTAPGESRSAPGSISLQCRTNDEDLLRSFSWCSRSPSPFSGVTEFGGSTTSDWISFRADSALGRAVDRPGSDRDLRSTIDRGRLLGDACSLGR